MKFGHHIRDYQANVYWDEAGPYFVAEIPEIPFCAADGKTVAEAYSNLEETFAVVKEAYAEDGEEIPAPQPKLPVTAEALSTASSVLKISQVAEMAGIPPQTLHAKLERKAELKPDEARRISSVLASQGIRIIAEGTGGREAGGAST